MKKIGVEKKATHKLYRWRMDKVYNTVTENQTQFSSQARTVLTWGTYYKIESKQDYCYYKIYYYSESFNRIAKYEEESLCKLSF